MNSPVQRPLRARPSGKGFWSSLPRKTMGGFVAALLAILVIWFVSYRSVGQRAVEASRMQQTLEVTKHLELLLSNITDAETGQRGFLLTGLDRYLEPYTTALHVFPREVEKTRLSMLDDPRQAERLLRVEDLALQKLAELKETIDLQRAGEREQALKLVQEGRGKELMDRIRELIDEMRQIEEAELAQRTLQWERSTAWATVITTSGSAVLLFLTFAAGIMVTRDFRDQAIQVWLRSGHNELSQALQGEQEIPSIGATAASFLARYLDAQLGVVYLAENKQLQPVGSWGLALATDAAPHVQAQPPVVAAAALPRQVFEDNQLAHVRDVPSDYFVVSSGVGQRKPREVVLVPVTSDGVPNGVLEFGFFRTLASFEIELLTRVAETVGIAFRSAKYRNHLRNLLEETQRQADNLQAQQEELRVTNEELEQHTRALHVSQAQLQNQQAELEQINAQLEEQTQSLGQQRDDLKRAQVELQRANAYKSEFLANMSHELRTPLNSSLILAKLLLDNRDGNLSGEQVKFAQTIYSAGNDLLVLINDILDLSKIEAGKLEVRAEAIPVARLFDELKATFQPVANEQKLELQTNIDANVPTSLHTDSMRLQQILRNLLSNAFKFTERGGVFLQVSRAPNGHLAFAVRDTGIGIAAEQHEAIFEAFRQADGTTNRKYGGTGLGLSISRDLARLLGGELSVASTPGRGSTFTLTLPVHYAASAPDGTPRPIVSSLGGSTASQTRTPRAPDVIADDRERLNSGSRSLLIIEDDAAFTSVLQDLAHELHFHVLTASTAEVGLKLAERYHPSAIVLDVGLPDRSGLSVLDALKHNPSTRHIPVHIVSGDDHAQTALEMGAAGYAIKPIQREELVRALQRLEQKVTQKLRRVLVVEDDAVHRESTCQLISSADVECIAVGSAAEALEKLVATTFDCLVLDLSLPDRTGFELLQELAHKEHNPFPPVIVYTGRSLSLSEEQELRRFSSSIIVKGARSPERLLDEVTLFLHQVESELPADRQRMLRDVRHREKVFEKRRVLIVEDDVRNIFALTSALEPKGAIVEIARNGREALDFLASGRRVDLVLMDIMMPEMDGITAMREIRKQPEHAKLPIIALTAKAMSDDRENCLAAGANDYIAKPLDVDKLLSLARVWMSK